MAEDRALLIAGAACLTTGVMAWRADRARQAERALRRDYQSLQRRLVLAEHRRAVDDQKAAIGAAFAEPLRSAYIGLTDSMLQFQARRSGDA